MELASMLAGEPFSDHPRSVCPVIGAYMRTLNDGLSDSARQELYGYAAEIVDTRSSRRVRRARARACARWSYEMGAVSRFRATVLGLWGGAQTVGSMCAKAALGSGHSDSFALAVADGLIEIGRGPAERPERERQAEPGAPAGDPLTVRR